MMVSIMEQVMDKAKKSNANTLADVQRVARKVQAESDRRKAEELECQQRVAANLAHCYEVLRKGNGVRLVKGGGRR